MTEEKIYIEKEPYSITRYYSGSIDYQNEWFQFTLEIIYLNDLDIENINIIWIDGEPESPYIEELTDQIIDQFHKNN